jgi:deoxyribose-phosphate aldolase
MAANQAPAAQETPAAAAANTAGTDTSPRGAADAAAAATRAAARQALACLDLTSLNDGDTAADVLRLCERAVGCAAPGTAPRGPVAAVCVWPRFAALARHALPRHIAVAAVANFPDGSADVDRAVRDVREIVAAGADEVDVVLPWRRLEAAPRLLKAVRRACEGRTLKVILETGELASDAAIERACRIALEAGADFLKTSTGKARVNATPHAARLLLQAIAADARARDRVGFKPAGGIRTVADAAVYLALTSEALGAGALHPARFRIGASSLLDDIEAVLLGTGSHAPPSGPAGPDSY